MKLPRLLLVVVLLTSPGCERVRALASGWMGKEKVARKAVAIAGPLVTELSEGEMESFPRKRGRLAIVAYHAEWSGPSRQITPLFETIAAEYGGVVVVGKVDVDRFRPLATQEGVKDLPDVRIYRDGSLVDRFVGLRDENEIRERIARLAKGLSREPEKAAQVRKAVAEPMPKDWMPAGMRRR